MSAELSNTSGDSYLHHHDPLPFTASPVNTILGSVSAHDTDSGSRIRYTILPDTITAKNKDGRVLAASETPKVCLNAT